MGIHKVSLNIEYQGRDCVAVCSFYSESDELDILSLVDCNDVDCMPAINTQDYYRLENEVDSVFELFDGENGYGKWIK